MEILVWILSYLLLSYLVMGLLFVFKPDGVHAMKTHERFWVVVAVPILFTSMLILYPIYGFIWLCTGDWVG